MTKVVYKEEMLQILNSNGEPTGSFEFRSVVHKKGLLHHASGLTVKIII